MSFIAKEEIQEIYIIADLTNCAVEMPLSLPFGQGELKVMGEAWVCSCTGVVSSPPLGCPTHITHHTGGWAPCLSLPTCCAPDCHSSLSGQSSACVADKTKHCTTYAADTCRDRRQTLPKMLRPCPTWRLEWHSNLALLLCTQGKFQCGLLLPWRYDGT